MIENLAETAGTDENVIRIKRLGKEISRICALRVTWEKKKSKRAAAGCAGRPPLIMKTAAASAG